MKDCIYYIRGEKIGDIYDLISSVKEKYKNKYTKEIDIIYSISPKEALREGIQELKVQFLKDVKELTSSKSASTYEDELGYSKGISEQEFLDDDRCVIDGRSLIRPYNKLDFINAEAANIIEKNNWKDLEGAEEKALELVQLHLAHGDMVREDSIIIHKLLAVADTSTDGNDFAESEKVRKIVKGTRFEGRKNILRALHTSFKNFENSVKSTIGFGSDSAVIRNFGVTAHIDNLDIDIHSHIDYLIIDNFGNVHVFKYKAALDPYFKWSKDKRIKYDYSLAFTKQMLIQQLKEKGLNPTSVQMHIVPITVEYDDQYKIINKAIVGNSDNRSTSYEGKGRMLQYENDAKYFIKSDFVTPNVTDRDDDVVRDFFNEAVPLLNARSEGLHRSAVQIARRAPESGSSEPVLIRKNNDGKWEVKFQEEEEWHLINSEKGPKETNSEILQLISEHFGRIEDDNLDAVRNLFTGIQVARTSGTKGIKYPLESLSKIKGIAANSPFIKGILAPYFNDYQMSEDGKTKVYNWEFIPDLMESHNILLVQNKLKDRLDVITLTAYDTEAELPMNNGTHNILGKYLRDGQVNTLPSTYGSAELLRTMLLLNQILPKLKLNEYALGKIRILSHTGTSQQYNISDISQNYLPTIIKTVTEKTGYSIVNNFSTLAKDNFVDPIKGIVEDYLLAINSMDEASIESYGSGKFQNLIEVMDSENKAAKLTALHALLVEFSTNQFLQLKGLSIEKIYQYANGGDTRVDPNLARNCRFYMSISDAYHYYKGDLPKYEKPLEWVNKQMSTTTHVGNSNIRIITEGAATTFNNIAESTEEYHSKHIRGILREFQKKKGYDTTRNAIIGDEIAIYKNLFDPNKQMVFKNPYEDPNLDVDERDFLKKILYQFYLIRNGFRNVKGYSGYDDSKIAEDLKNPANQEYLNAPLCRASSSTKVYQNFNISTWKARFKRILNILRNPKKWYYEFEEQLSEAERILYAEDQKQLTLHNPFDIGDNKSSNDPNSRQRYLEQEGVEFFETNVDNLITNYLYQAIKTAKLNDYLVGAKSLLFQLHVMGEEAGNSTRFNQEIEYIKDFLKVNVYNDSIKDNFGRYVTGLLAPVRTQVTLINLGGNLVSFFRDIFQGFQENFMRVFTKLNTDIEAKYLRNAYAYVITHGITNSMNIDMLSKLQTKYRLSNIDLASAESLKLGRGGILNYKNWAFATLRRPDFLNRMTLFVARCMQDGVWEAYSIKDDQLVYDWKKDKRFKALVDGTSKDSMEYKKAKALYMSKVKEWNEEHPDREALPYNPEKVEEGLPAPYSDAEILAIKGLADNIYGAYDKVLKARAEHTTWMWFFGMYTTWMNGIYNNYFLKPGYYKHSRMVSKQETDEAGNLLYWQEDGSIDTTVTDMPVYHNVPTIIQGIWYTMQDIFHMLKGENGWKTAWTYMTSDPVAKANMRKLLSDLFMWLFLSVIFKYALMDPAYKDYKKEMKSNPVVANLGVEMIYKATYRSWDSFQGPLNYIDWLFENNESPIYEVNTKLIQDAGKVIFGDKKVMDAVVGNFGFTRLGTDTYSAWKKAQK